MAAILRAEGRLQSWLARSIGVSPEHTNRVLRGKVEAMPEFRAKVAALLNRPESELFHLAGGSERSSESCGSSVPSRHKPVGVATLEGAA